MTKQGNDINDYIFAKVAQRHTEEPAIYSFNYSASECECALALGTVTERIRIWCMLRALSLVPNKEERKKKTPKIIPYALFFRAEMGRQKLCICSNLIAQLTRPAHTHTHCTDGSCQKYSIHVMLY